MCVAVFAFVVRIFLEFLYEIAILVHAHGAPYIVILLAVMGSCLNVSSSGFSSLKETSWAISAKVFTWKLPVRLMTMGIIFASAFRVP